MNKEEIINEINKLNLDKDEFWILGSSSLVLRGIIEKANDIDIAITEELYKKLKTNYELIYLGNNHNTKWYKINDIVECCVDKFSKEKIDIREPFNLLNIEYYYNNYLKNSTREKDKKKKELLEKKFNNRE